MKPYNYLLIPIMILPLLSSCAKEDKIDGPVSLNPYVAGISLTRAGASQANDLSAIGLYAVNEDKNLKTYGTWPAGTYGKYSKQQNGSFKPADAAQTIWLNLEKAIIFACHPAQSAGSAITDGNASSSSSATNPIPCIPVPADAISLAPAITAPATGSVFDFTTPANDYMYGVEYDSGVADGSQFKTTQPIADNGRATGAAGNNVAIGLKHAFSQIKLVITKGPTYTGNAVVSNVKYSRSMQTLDEAESSGVKMQLTDGNLVGLKDASSKEYQYNLSTLSGGFKITDNMTITNYCLPNVAAASTITVVVDGKEMSITYTGDPVWEAGKINTYKVTINGTGLTFSGFSIVDWNESNDNNSSGTL